jgi:hypothetical protein
MGLLEGGPDGYRNLELASRYLVENSPQTLRPALLYQAAHLAPLSSVGRYLLNGREDGASSEIEDLHRQSCECLARYAAPFVLDKLDLAPHNPALLIGWGGGFYRELAAQRWPGMTFEVRNPFESNGNGNAEKAIVNGGGRYSSVLLSGLLAGLDREQFAPALASAVGLVKPGGLLILHDSFVCSDAAPAPEVLLFALGRHVMRGGSGNWSISRLESEFHALGWRVLLTEPIPGGTQLVTASAV